MTSYTLPGFQKAIGSDQEHRGFFFNESKSKRHFSTEPFRTCAYSICLLLKGELQVEADLVHNRIVAPAIFVVGPTVIRKFIDSDAGFHTQVIFFEKEYFLRNQVNINYLEQYQFFHDRECHYIKLTKSQFENIQAYFKLLKRKVAEDNEYTPMIVRSLIYILLHEISRLYGPKKNGVETFSPKVRIVSQFKERLAINYLRHRDVRFYASLASLSPKHFSSVIKEQTGKTAGEWIDEMVLLESKILLQKKELTIAQVADQLNFSDPSTFGKFFKNLTGQSPSAYRKNI